MDENQQNQNEHVYSTVAKNPYLLPEPQKKSRIPWIVGIVVAVLVSFGLGIGFCLWVLRDAPTPAPVETAPGTQMADTAAHITDADMAETHGKPQDPPEDVTPEDATEPPVDPSVTGLPEVSVQPSPEPETPPKPDNPIDPETTACNHQYGAWLVTAPATCTVAGMQMQSCQLCGEVRKEPIEPTGHTEEEVPAVAPTCTDHGYTAGIICTECGMMVVEQEVVPAAHTPGEWIIDEEPALGIEGSRHTTCTVCGAAVEETIEMLYSQGLAYTSNGDGTCYVSGLGTCTDTEIVIPATHNGMSVVSINEYAFIDCSNLTSVIIPDSVTSIGNAAFCRSGISSVIIGNSVVNIAASAFAQCDNLVSVNIPDSVTHLGRQAFASCPTLTSVVIGSGVVDIGQQTFWGIKNSFTVSEQNSFYCSVDGVLFNKDITELIQVPCLKSGNYVIPQSVTTICSFSFCSCSELTSITLPDGLISIGDGAFKDCVSLVAISLPESVTSIGESAFIHCTKLSSVNLPNGITEISQAMFWQCFSLTSISIPESVTSIGDSAFVYTGLTSITIPKNVTSIGKWPFDMTDLTEILVEEGNPAYYSTGNCLIEIQSKTVIAGCDTSIIPADGSVVRIQDYAFKDCGFTSFVIPESITEISANAFHQCSALSSIVIPDNVTILGKDAFWNCRSLTEIILGNGLTSINEGTFQNCVKLTTIIMSRNVKTIGRGAFNGCQNLSVIYFTGTEAEWNAITIGSDNANLINATVHFNYVP